MTPTTADVMDTKSTVPAIMSFTSRGRYDSNVAQQRVGKSFNNSVHHLEHQHRSRQQHDDNSLPHCKRKHERKHKAQRLQQRSCTRKLCSERATSRKPQCMTKAAENAGRNHKAAATIVSCNGNMAAASYCAFMVVPKDVQNAMHHQVDIPEVPRRRFSA